MWKAKKQLFEIHTSLIWRKKLKSIIFQAEEPTAELSNDAENIEMNEDEKQAFQYLNLQLSNLIQDLTKHKAQRYRQLWKLCINF